MITEDKTQRGCWVLNPETEKHDWRPVTIEYSDETYIAIKTESDPRRGLREGERVHLSPLSEAKNLNLEEGVRNKGMIDLKKTNKTNASSSEEEDDGVNPSTGAEGV